MLETIMVLVMFFFLVAIGLKFYGNIQIQELKKTQTEFERLDSIKVANILMTLPELSCTTFNEFEGSCVDYHKAQSWNQTDPDIMAGAYLPVFGYAKIELKLLYPEERIDHLPDKNIIIYNTKPTNVINSITTEIPIVSYNAINRTKDFGMLSITTYQGRVI